MPQRYYGAYIGTVENNIDPLDIGRVQIRLEDFHGDSPTTSLPWARVAAKGIGYGQGPQPVPQIGVDVCMVFEQGRPENPLIIAEMPTELDKRNAAKRTYTAGDQEHTVEGNRTDFAGGSHTIKSNRNIILEAVGSVTTTARQMVSTINGLRRLVAKREEVDIQGSSERTVRGVADQKYLSDLTKAIVGKFNLSAAQGLDIFVMGIPLLQDFNITTLFNNFVVNAMTPGIIWLRQRSPIPDPTGLLDLATVKTDPLGNVYVLSNTGFVRVGRVATQGLEGTPVTLVAHTHVGIGNLGIPFVVAPTVPAPPNISATLLA